MAPSRFILWETTMAKSSVARTPKRKASFKNRFVPDHAELEKLVKELKKKGSKVVLTQGVYDLIHEGHARYLEAAKSYGDILVVGVDSDELTKMRKGPNRPIVPQGERVTMLLHLRHVDVVTVREAKHDIGELIRLVRPDVLVTSSSTEDFKKDLDSGKYNSLCGKIIVLPPQATTTTTARIRNLTIEGAEKLALEVQKLTENFLRNIHEG
jgi:rfaE bifunctional protein nucleotidyltransferase chain/domain